MKETFFSEPVAGSTLKVVRWFEYGLLDDPTKRNVPPGSVADTTE
jgi:hypothetical protein